MALQSYSLIPKRTKKTHRVVADSFRVLIPTIEDLGRVVQEVSAVEITKQISIGNNPQNIVVDGSGTKPFNQADWRVTAYFANPIEVAKAAVDILIQLEKLTKVESGDAKRSYEIWTVKDKDDNGKLKDGNASKSLSKMLGIANKLPVGGKIVIVGPTVDYGRKLYWRPKGKFKGRSSRKSAYSAETGKTSLVRGSRSTSMADLVIARVKRKHKGVIVRGRWIVKDGLDWPGIGVGLVTKGMLN